MNENTASRDVGHRSMAVRALVACCGRVRSGGVWGREYWKCRGRVYEQTSTAADERRVTLELSESRLQALAAVLVDDDDIERRTPSYGCGCVCSRKKSRARILSAYSIFFARIAIMAMLAIIIGVLTIATWHSTKVFTTKSIEELALHMRIEIWQRPSLRMWTIFNTTLQATMTYSRLASYVIDEHAQHLSDPNQIYSAMRKVSWALFASQSTLTTMTVIHSNGRSQGFERNIDTNKDFYKYSLPKADVLTSPSQLPAPESSSPSQAFLLNASSASFQWYAQVVDGMTGDDVGPYRKFTPFDIIQDFGGITLLELDNIAWRASVHRRFNAPFLACGCLVRHPRTQDVVAIAGVTVGFASISRLIKQLAILHLYNLTMFLTDTDGWLLASSTSSPLMNNSTANGPTLLRAEESRDPIIKTTAEWLIRSHGFKGDDIHRENVILLGTPYYLDTFTLNLGQLRLVGIVVTPRSAILGTVQRRGRTALAVLISISLAFFAVGCSFILVFTWGVSNQMKLRSEIINHLNARRRAEASSIYKSQFLANMSHELRTPMAAVIGLLDILLSDEYMTSEQVAMMTQIRQCSTSLLRLLNNILDLSKVESGKLHLEEEDFDLRHELEGLVELFSVQCFDKDLEIVLDLADDVPHLLRGDSTRTVQVFANLIANSIKFTTSGHVLVRGRCDQPDKICLTFEVDDTGCGIDPSKWETVFGSFVQADPSTTRTYGGTGLGLCIVRSLVQSMGGEIKVVKKDGPGTMLKFHMYFQQSPKIETAETSNCKTLCMSSLCLEKLQHSRVLFSLKAHTGRRVLSRWMTERGLRVSERSTWEDTIAGLEELVMMDDERFSVPKMQPLAILDIGLVSTPGDLDILDSYKQQGVMIGWFLNHDTSSFRKGDLRERGYSIMVKKPLYISKLIQLLRMLVGCSDEEDHLALGGQAHWKPPLQRSLNSLHYDGEEDCRYHKESPATEQEPAPSFLKSESASEATRHSQPNVVQIGHGVGVLETHQNDPLVFDIHKQGNSRSSPKLQNGENNQSRVHEIEMQSPSSSSSLDCTERQRTFHGGDGDYLDIRQINPDAQQRLEGSADDLSEAKPVRPPKTASASIRQPQLCRSSSSSSCGRSDALKGLRILLAEDTPVLQRVATMILEKMGATVIPVNDGLQAVDALTTILESKTQAFSDVETAVTRQLKYPDPDLLPFDLVLMDCQMPKMDGYDATRVIREAEEGTNCHIPIVALTAHAMSSDEANCLEVGMDAYLTKPIDIKLLTSTISLLTKSPPR